MCRRLGVPPHVTRSHPQAGDAPTVLPSVGFFGVRSSSGFAYESARRACLVSSPFHLICTRGCKWLTSCRPCRTGTCYQRRLASLPPALKVCSHGRRLRSCWSEREEERPSPPALEPSRLQLPLSWSSSHAATSTQRRWALRNNIYRKACSSLASCTVSRPPLQLRRYQWLQGHHRGAQTVGWTSSWSRSPSSPSHLVRLDRIVGLCHQFRSEVYPSSLRQLATRRSGQRPSREGPRRRGGQQTLPRQPRPAPSPPT